MVTLDGIADGQTLYEGVGVQLNAAGTSPLPVTRTDILIDGAQLASTPASTTSYAWIGLQCPGLPPCNHSVTARAWNEAGSTSLTKTIQVTVDPIDVPFRAKLDSLKSALGSGNRQAAMDLLSPGAQLVYGPIIDALAPYLAGIVASWPPPVRLSSSAGGADYAVKRMVNGVPKIYVISFVLDDNGNWVIDSM